MRATSPIVVALHRLGVCAGPLALPGLERVRWRIGQLGAWRAFEFARRRVPAYAAFLAAQRASAPAAFDAIPPTDKASYIAPYSLDDRCVDGRLPGRGVVIDESSGSSGLPTNWVRGERERRAHRRAFRLGLRATLGHEPPFVINAFALGPWATGLNLTMAMAPSCVLKSLGPDIVKIANTLRQFGAAPHYFIVGYPPFLKALVDQAGIDWTAYRVSMAFGGESMGESMRRYLVSKGIRRVYGSYGASDLDINLAVETDFTIALRQLLEARPSLAARFRKHPGAMPMVFQFNPSEFFIETTNGGELLITACRPGAIAPKVRYNIHDLGHVMRFPELVRHLADEGLGPQDLGTRVFDLPVLFHYGRSDLSAAYFGCKIAPADVQEALFRIPALAPHVDGFQLRTFEDGDGDKRLALALEVSADFLTQDPSTWSAVVFDVLAEVNQDFRESRRMVGPDKRPFVEWHAAGTGPFAGLDPRAKRRYLRT